MRPLALASLLALLPACTEVTIVDTSEPTSSTARAWVSSASETRVDAICPPDLSPVEGTCWIGPGQLQLVAEGMTEEANGYYCVVRNDEDTTRVLEVEVNCE